jgi:hypothetical protein
MAHTFQAEAIAQLDLLGGIFAKGIYLLVVAFAVYVIIKVYGGYLNETSKAIDSMGL